MELEQIASNQDQKNHPRKERRHGETDAQGSRCRRDNHQQTSRQPCVGGETPVVISGSLVGRRDERSVTQMGIMSTLLSRNTSGGGCFIS
jgi:hypothetical protein